MLTYYCPNCWAIVEEDALACPQCGYALERFSQNSYEQKLLSALHHAVPERRIMAAQILGNRASQTAVPVFLAILNSDEDDYFFLRAVLMAAAKIDHPDRAAILERAANHPSSLIRNLAGELRDQPPGDDARWDRHTG